ncbi:glutamate--cysteine ligase [Thalassotalea agarivorans]|uniref:Glutamate--cysteine ligase n=1 Tax=Thalassotalea agarivorans TaxID=349064 RepID=A0A1I0AMA1_THASX|nr:glutamate--cysteine ligase [Thalassotalea agarivorans]SES95289.1 glutamate-cysteine ligase [Thalassotalea agarivorans]
MTQTIKAIANAFEQADQLSLFTQFGRGIEREGLRIHPDAKLSEHGHYAGLGSALTHPAITTDYSETLLEFITPVSFAPTTVIEQLQDIQKYTFSQIDGELLWPMSMPCFVEDADTIELANYGTSNIGTMKTVYRKGLKNRYGSMMQVIAGIHFNFSFPKAFWQQLQIIKQDTQDLQAFINEGYFALLRNYKRYAWLLPYLYGSSPAICPSFLQNKETDLPFKKDKTGFLYLEHATSLRMSDLGYTNSEQSSFNIGYNSLNDYLDGVSDAITHASEKFAEIGVKVNGEYQQLNTNVLQIENELYAPIRPKQVAKSGEKPSEALAKRGVEYIEVRVLDVNPFVSTGISLEQVYFLDVFLTFCALKDSPLMTNEQQKAYRGNLGQVVVRGLDPALTLYDQQQRSIKDWGEEIFAGLSEVATLLDKAAGESHYADAVEREYQKVLDPNKTFARRFLHDIQSKNLTLTEHCMNLAKQYRKNAMTRDYSYCNAQNFEDMRVKSLADQAAIEAADTVDFDTFLTDYFS